MRVFVVLSALAVAAPALGRPHKKAPAAAPADADADKADKPPQKKGAQIKPPAVESELVLAGMAAYDELDYPKCVDTLQKALAETLTRQEKIVLYQTLAFCHVALDKPDAAKFDFENLLRLDETFELDRTVSPRVRAPFEEAKAAIATGESVEGGAGEVRLPTVHPALEPRTPREGQALAVSVRFAGGAAVKAEVFYRARGQAVFLKAASPGTPDGEFVVTLPGLHVTPPGLEYYLVLLDDAGASVARAGSLANPLFVDVVARKRPVYTKAWFWGVIGGVVAAGAIVGGVVAATAGSSSIGKNTPATVTIMPQ